MLISHGILLSANKVIAVNRVMATTPKNIIPIIRYRRLLEGLFNLVLQITNIAPNANNKISNATYKYRAFSKVKNEGRLIIFFSFLLNEQLIII